MWADAYISDTGNHRVQRFGYNNAFKQEWGGRGTGEGRFNRPTGICADPSGNIYVVDGGNQRVQRFSGDGEFHFELGEEGTGEGQFQFTPRGGMSSVRGRSGGGS